MIIIFTNWEFKIRCRKFSIFGQKYKFIGQDLDIWPKVRFFENVWIRFLGQISIFDKNFYFWPKFLFLTKISIFEKKKYYFWPKFRFLTKISIFDQNFDVWPKFRFLTKISIFNQHLIFGQIFEIPKTFYHGKLF